MNPLAISHFTYTSCLGAGNLENWQAIESGNSGLKPCDFPNTDLPTWIGEVDHLDIRLPHQWQEYDCRNNRLAWVALNQDGFISRANKLKEKYGADRIGVFMGTSTSGIYQSELAYMESSSHLPDWYHLSTTHNISSISKFVQKVFSFRGPCLSISTACSSSAKVFASAQRAIVSGLCDAAIVGGVDSLCLTTLYGFHSLQLLSTDPCQPFDQSRKGISIGEAGGFAILEKNPEADLFLLGFGESSDAYHMSSPHPEGEGAAMAMTMALQKANLEKESIDYINLHGTGTIANDAAESIAVSTAVGNETPASSTKGWTGHTLGAAGVIEACICLQAIENNFLPKNQNINTVDANTNIHILQQSMRKKIRTALSNSFGFGGSNASLVLGKR
ncbi:MAG: beta-ketoacyl-[acyl-carrier-protein] synthase family protein [Cellvibrio sp.]|nr:beta-ketoacyl-[acyl-carrier-protein] synthase family protein [Cellvibrio sp.]